MESNRFSNGGHDKPSRIKNIEIEEIVVLKRNEKGKMWAEMKYTRLSISITN